MHGCSQGEEPQAHWGDGLQHELALLNHGAWHVLMPQQPVQRKLERLLQSSPVFNTCRTYNSAGTVVTTKRRVPARSTLIVPNTKELNLTGTFAINLGIESASFTSCTTKTPVHKRLCNRCLSDEIYKTSLLQQLKTPTSHNKHVIGYTLAVWALVESCMSCCYGSKMLRLILPDKIVSSSSRSSPSIFTCTCIPCGWF